LLLPSWDKVQAQIGGGVKLHLRLKPTGPAGSVARAAGAGTEKSMVGLDQLCDFNWEVSLGGVDIPVDEFKRLVRLKVPVVEHRGEWLVFDPDAAQKTLDFLDSSSASGQASLGTLMRHSLGLEPDGVLGQDPDGSPEEPGGGGGDPGRGLARRRLREVAVPGPRGSGAGLGEFRREAAPLPAAGPFLAAVPGRLRTRRMPRRRHGPWEDRPIAGASGRRHRPRHRRRRSQSHPAGLSHLGDGQLAARSPALRAASARAAAPRTPAIGRRGFLPRREAHASGDRLLRARRPRPGRPAPGTLEAGDPGRGPEHQESRHATAPGGQEDPGLLPLRPHRHPG
jgi:hypothetical protein